MASEGEDCPSCNDRSKSEQVANNADATVRPWTPPTADELALTRQMYAVREVRANDNAGVGSARSQSDTRAELRGNSSNRDASSEVKSRAGAEHAAWLSDRGGDVRPRGADSRLTAKLPGSIRHAFSEAEVALPRLLNAPWHYPTEGMELQETDGAVPDIEETFPNDTPKDEVADKDGYANGKGKYIPLGKINRNDEPTHLSRIECNETAHYFDFEMTETIVLAPELSYWADAGVRGRIVKYPAVPDIQLPGGEVIPGTPEQIIEERPPASSADAESGVQAHIDEFLRAWFDGEGHYADGAMLVGEIDRLARLALRAHHDCSRDIQCRMVFRVLRRKFNVIAEVGKDRPPEWRRGTESGDYEWEKDSDGRQVAKRQRIYVKLKVTVTVSLHYWVVVKCVPR